MAKKLNKIVKDQEHTKPFEFHNQGSLAYLGDWCVVIVIKSYRTLFLATLLMTLLQESHL